MLRWLMRFLAIAAVALISSCTTAAYVTLKSLTNSPRSQLTKDLFGGEAAMSVEFDKRIKAHFPVGSYVKDMGQILNDNEFQHD